MLGKRKRRETPQELLGGNIRSLRLRRGWSQEKLAEETDLHRTYIGGIERGERNVSVRNIGRIADSLDVAIMELFKDHS